MSEHKIPVIILLLGLVFVVLGVHTATAEIKTIAIFCLFELIIIAIIFLIVDYAEKLVAIRTIVYKTLSNFILGLHLTAGMIVLGVYFTL